MPVQNSTLNRNRAVKRSLIVTFDNKVQGKFTTNILNKAYKFFVATLAPSFVQKIIVKKSCELY